MVDVPHRCYIHPSFIQPFLSFSKSSIHSSIVNQSFYLFRNSSIHYETLPFIPRLFHSFRDSFIHSETLSFIPKLFHSFRNSSINSETHIFIRQPLYSFMNFTVFHSPFHSFKHLLFIHQPFHSFTNTSLVIVIPSIHYQYLHSFINPFIHSSFRSSFINPSIHSSILIFIHEALRSLRCAILGTPKRSLKGSLARKG